MSKRSRSGRASAWDREPPSSPGPQRARLYGALADHENAALPHTMHKRRNPSTCLRASRECSQKGRGRRQWLSRGHGTRQLVPCYDCLEPPRRGASFWHGRCACKRRTQIQETKDVPVPWPGRAVHSRPRKSSLTPRASPADIAAGLALSATFAEAFPSKPIRFVVGPTSERLHRPRCPRASGVPETLGQS